MISKYITIKTFVKSKPRTVADQKYARPSPNRATYKTCSIEVFRALPNILTFNTSCTTSRFQSRTTHSYSATGCDVRILFGRRIIKWWYLNATHI